jgi:AIPR protein
LRTRVVSTHTYALTPPAREFCVAQIERFSGVTALILLEEFPRQKLYDTLSSATDPTKICLTVELEDWAEIADPLVSFYGRVPLSAILEWQKHGKDLFHRNLRGYLADPALMSSQVETLKGAPQHFWYFNNGATLLCDRIKKKPLHGDSRKRGLFDCCGVSVVNGAQTIGIVWDYAGDGSGLDPRARLPVRLVSLEGADQEFSSRATKALNTQRRIEGSDFVALDPIQQRLRRDMALDGRTYIVRPSDLTGADDEFTFQDAATALACASGQISLAVLAKRVVSRLWESTTSPPYTSLFPSSIEADTVWRAMVIQKAILDKISDLREQATERHKTILSHGNRFIEYKVFRSPSLRGFASHAIPIEDLRGSAVVATDKISRRLCNILCGPWREEPVQYIFKYIRKCEALDPLIERPDDQDPMPQGTLF